jgi:Uma2 family endonuclease
MPAPLRKPMTSDEFILWAMARPEGERYELVNGEVVGMSPERLVHAEVKGLVWLALRTALAAAGRLCVAYPDGVSVQVDGNTTYQPDALVRCGNPLPGETIRLNDPVIGVGVVSPSSGAPDTGAKLEDYFRATSVRHYLIVRTDGGGVIHHERRQDGGIVTRTVREVVLELGPPGIEVPVATCFP